MRSSLSSPAEAEAAFYTAFRSLDILGMRQAWADLPGVYCVHPSGQLFVGYEPVMQSWSRIFQGADNPQLLHSLIAKSYHPEVVVHLVEERIGPAGSPYDSLSLVLATNQFVSTEDGWRMLVHHASPVPSGATATRFSTRMH